MTRLLAILIACLPLVASAQYRLGYERTTSIIPAGGVGPLATMPDDLYASCVLWQSFGRNSGTSYWDMSRSANNGMATNAATQPLWDSANGGNLTFDGTTDFVSITHSDSMNTSDSGGAFWFAAWLSPLSSGGYRVATKSTISGGDTNQSWDLFTGITANTSQWRVHGNADGSQNVLCQAPPIPSNTFVFVVGVYTGGVASTSMQLWTNAVNATTQQVATSFAGWNTNSSTVRIGRGVNTDTLTLFSGTIYDVKLGLGVMRPTSITNLYNTSCRTYGLTPK